MGSKENAAQRECWLAAGQQGCKIHRINSGMAWAGKPERQRDGAVRLDPAQPVNLGFSDPQNKPVSGPPDLFGWKPVVITPDMVGCTVAVVVGFEAKPRKGGTVSDDQYKFGALMRVDGGIHAVVRTPNDVEKALANWRPPRYAAPPRGEALREAIQAAIEQIRPQGRLKAL